MTGFEQFTHREIVRAFLRPIVAAIILLAGYFVLPINKASDANLFGLAIGAALLTWFCVWEIKQFLSAKYPVAQAIEMIVALATFYIVAFATTYYLFSEYADGSFNQRLTRIDALYFCLTVFTTTGFGDISAQSQPARVVVSIQMASTLILLGLGIRLFNLLLERRTRAVAPPRQEDEPRRDDAE